MQAIYCGSLACVSLLNFKTVLATFLVCGGYIPGYVTLLSYGSIYNTLS